MFGKLSLVVCLNLAATHPAILHPLAYKHAMLRTDTIPSDPQATHKRYVHDEAMDRTVIGQNNAVPKHISGYSGFVPQIRDAALGETFASHCAKVMNRHMDAKNDRRALNAKPVGGFAFSGTSTKPKAKLVVKDVGLNLTYTAQ